MDLKRKVLEEILADIDDKEGLRLKPKAVEMEAELEAPEKEGMPEEMGAKGEPDENEEMSDDDLKALLKHYRG